MTIQSFIEKAIEGGWKQPYHTPLEPRVIAENLKENVMLDPLAWKAVGKVEGWYKFSHTEEQQKLVYVAHMRCLMDALADGKTIEQYLETL